MSPSPTFINATTRAARIMAAVINGSDHADTLQPLREARHDGRVTELVLALAVRCADIARDAYGDQAPTRLDEFAFDALNYAQRHLGGQR